MEVTDGKNAPLNSCISLDQNGMIIPEVSNYRRATMTSKKTTKTATPMTVEAAQRIQSATATANGGKVPKGSFAARAMSKAAKSKS
ncbi:hypothetical protein [Lacimicrobium sp. SS2-24]|uniref:hypothetical protein n=1 Tax=Lacimicrobium sp. SS2-24 TaxID=2005569 RepID=UPI001130DC97|nr:hypothetical protein [Lacimicrobium sp. SS2-24]